ncbi:MAG: hypothetical protein ACQES8_08980 [Thermodesulfobacteriota bacterium]
MVGDIAFVPIEVLMVTVIIHRLLEVREKKAIMEKLNMVIGTFFSEVGRELLRKFTQSDPNLKMLRQETSIDGEWTGSDFDRARAQLKRHNCRLEMTREELKSLQLFLLEKRQFLVDLLQNPNLLEHEAFTDVLWAVFHLADELSHREDVDALPETDIAHLGGDAERAYGYMLLQWLDYMEHLKNNYPYLFSLGMRTNPFKSGGPQVIA